MSLGGRSQITFLIAYEVLHSLKRKRGGKIGSFALKLNMSKAYDKIEWLFLEDMMISLGFCSKWVELLLRCVKSVSYSVVLNGTKGEEFKPTRGLRQGDLLSTYLLIIYAEGFSRPLKITKSEGFISRVRQRRGELI